MIGFSCWSFVIELVCQRDMLSNTSATILSSTWHVRLSRNVVCKETNSVS